MSIDIADREIVVHFNEDEELCIIDQMHQLGFESEDDFVWYCVAEWFAANDIYFG